MSARFEERVGESDKLISSQRSHHDILKLPDQYQEIPEMEDSRNLNSEIGFKPRFEIENQDDNDSDNFGLKSRSSFFERDEVEFCKQLT